MASPGTPQAKRLAALASIAAIALIAAGCGGGSGSSESEAAARKKLEAGATKLSGARSFAASVRFELEEDGVPEELGCLTLSFDRGKPERFAVSYLDENCSGGSEGHEVIGIGARAWVATGSGSWTAATIAPELRKELDEEQTDNLGPLMRAAEDIEADLEGGAVEEAGGRFVDVTSYSFKAPASAFSDSEADDGQVEIEALVDKRGYLREVVVHGEDEGSGATVTDKFDAIEEDQGIVPPDPSEVHGATKLIHSSDELDALIGASLP
jgi:hypothetical protein